MEEGKLEWKLQTYAHDKFGKSADYSLGPDQANMLQLKNNTAEMTPFSALKARFSRQKRADNNRKCEAILNSMAGVAYYPSLP